LSPLEELYLVLAAIYLVDCLHWVRRDAQVFRARWRRFELQEGGALFGNAEAGLNLAWPLPPLGTIYVCERQSAGAENRYDTRWIAERRAAADAARALVLPWAHAQLLLCFVLAPVAIEQIGLVPLLPWLLAALLAVQLGGALAFARAHARLWPAERAARRGKLAALALSPPGLMRAADLLTRDLFAGRAGLAVACVLLERAPFEREAGRELRAARHPAQADTRELERFLRAQGLDPEVLDAPPERLGEDCLCYCPRCQSQFVIPAGSCERCSGLALVAFGPAREQRAEAQSRGARGP
jgi:hypothetical protein